MALENFSPLKFLKNFGRSKRITLTQKLFLVQQLAVMIRAGISLSVALKTLAEQSTSKGLKIILTDLQLGVEKGNLLSKSLEKYQRGFGELFISMVKAGEASGKLEDVLKQLFVQMKKDHDIVAKVRGAMMYPAIVVTMMVVIGILMMVYVIPTITTVFTELNVALPLPTRILIAVSAFSVHYGIFLLIGTVIGLTVLIRLERTEKGKKIFHTILLKLPIAGSIMMKINLARFCRSLSSLLKTDIPIVQSFEITSRILGNVIYREAILEAKEKIKKGVAIKDSLLDHGKLFPPVVLQMISVGEETGALDTILEESAIFYEDDVNQTMTNLPAIIEPVLMVILGIGVGGMAVAVIMPMYSLSESI